MTTFVVHGDEAPLKATLGGEKADTIDQVTFTIYRTGTGAEKVLDTIPSVPVKSRVATKDWTSKGLGDDEMQCTAYLRATAGKLKASGADPIVIYRDSLKIVAKDEAGKPAKNALVQLSMEVDPLFIESGAGAMVSRVARTDDTGTVELSGLPPGIITLTWRAPWAFKEWVPGKDKGPSREVTLKRVIRAKLLSHTTPPSPFKQYVNVAADVAHPEYGPKVKIKVGVHPASGPAVAGDKVFMKVSFWAENSALDAPLPKFEGSDGGKGKTVAAVGKVVGDDGTIEFDLDLGVAGGDHATVSVGGTDACGDDNVIFENWRRIPTMLYYPPQFPLTGGQLPAGIKDQVKASLAAVFIELDYLGATATTVNAVPVAADVGQKMGLPGAFNYFKIANSAGSSPEKGLNASLRTPETQLNILVGNYAIGWKDTPTNVELKSAKSGKLSAASGFLLPWSPDDTPPFTRFNQNRTASWECDGQSGDIDPSWFKHDGGRDYHFELPKGKGQPGSLVSKSKPCSLRFGLRIFNSTAGSSTANWILVTWKDASAVDGATYTLLHELGHSLGQAASDNSKTPGLPATHPNHYTGKQHSGNHCSFGLPANKKADADYSALLLASPPIHGKCIMWGGIGKGFRYAEANTFCADCKAYLLATKIDKVSQ